MPIFQHKPTAIEAFQVAAKFENEFEIIEWAHKGLAPESNSIISREERALAVRTSNQSDVSMGVSIYQYASPGDWIIKHPKRNFSVSTSDIFAATYEQVSL